MPFSLTRTLIAALLVSTFPLSSFGAGTRHRRQAEAATIVPANDPRFVYEGRFDTSADTHVGVVWQASRIRLDFEGDSLVLRFGKSQGQSFFDADIDGRRSMVEVTEKLAPKGVEFTHLGPGRHHLVLFKRSEASAGSARFEGVELPADGQAMKPTALNYKIALQFFGDSITAGACNEDGATDQWENYRTHNNALSYGAFTATAFSADYRNIAVSGMGVVIGYVPVTAGEIWNRTYPTSDAPLADLNAWTPDVAFVNLGENDDSFTKGKGVPFPESFAERYVALVRSFRQAYPAAQIVVLRGGMYGGARSERLRGPWEQAVKELESSDPKITHFVFDHWSSNHPRVADHRAMADELIAWLKSQPFMARTPAAK